MCVCVFNIMLKVILLCSDLLLIYFISKLCLLISLVFGLIWLCLIVLRIWYFWNWEIEKVLVIGVVGCYMKVWLFVMIF